MHACLSDEDLFVCFFKYSHSDVVSHHIAQSIVRMKSFLITIAHESTYNNKLGTQLRLSKNVMPHTAKNKY